MDSKFEDSLFRTQKVTDDENKAKQKASAFKSKLEMLRLKKQQQLEKKLKDKLVEHYQQHFEEFKNQIQKETSAQIASLQLVKQFKMSEICQVQRLIKQTKIKLHANLEEIEAHERKLRQNYELAVEFLEREQNQQLRELREQLEKDYNERIEEYKQSVIIQ